MGVCGPVQPFPIGQTCRKSAFFGIRRRAASIRKIRSGGGFVPVQSRANARLTINEARRLIERSRILCATAVDLARESAAIRISIQKALDRKRRVLRSN
jgi:hypothetical protein